MKKIFFYFFIFCSFFLFLGSCWWRNFLLPVNSFDKSTKIFVVSPGESLDSIARNLHKERLIKNPFGFKVLVSCLGIAKNLQAGDFRLSPSMEAKEIARELTHGTLDVWVTIPEGLRVEEVATIINSKLQIPNSKFIEAARKYEGFLFPDTYLIPKDADSKMIIKIMSDNFNKKIGKLIDLEKAKREEIKFNSLSLSEVITLASLIERETKHDEDRPKVASVLYNRLNIGMKLDIDASVQYVVGTMNCGNEGKKCDWWPKKLTSEDLKIDSPYNTYLYSGLPPMPICNPGLASIKAALSPAKTDYWYYLSDKRGKIHYAKTLNEQNENIKKYLISNLTVMP